MNDSISSADPQKQCNRCKKLLPLTAFTHDRGKKDGLCTICKACTRASKKPLPTPGTMKRCTKCGNEYPATSDFFSLSRRDGLKPWCKQCRKVEHRQYYDTSREQILRRSRQRYALNPEKDNTKGKEYRQKHKDDVNARRREAYRTFERDQRLASGRQSYAKNKVKVSQQHHVHYVRNREAYREKDRRYEARKHDVAGIHTAEQIREQYRRQKGKCYYCQQNITWGEHIIEHTYPLSRVAGTDIPANDLSYLVLACPTCNRKKGNKFPWEWPEGGRLL